jgi:hypothetical protein
MFKGISGLSFPLFFVFHRAGFMLSVFPNTERNGFIKGTPQFINEFISIYTSSRIASPRLTNPLPRGRLTTGSRTADILSACRLGRRRYKRPGSGDPGEAKRITPCDNEKAKSKAKALSYL